MIVITGFGRTGTSFLTSWLKEFNLITYEHGYTLEVNAGFEPLDVTIINNKLLDNTSTIDEVKTDILNFNYEVIKDPRFMYKDILPQWLSVRRDLKFLVLHRKFEDIHKSRVAFCEKITNSNSFILTPDEMQENLNKFINTCISNNLYIDFLYFPDFLDSYDLVWKKITAIGLTVDYESGKTAWNKLMDKTKIHYGVG